MCITNRTSPTDSNGEDRDFWCNRLANGTLPLSVNRLEGFTALLDIASSLCRDYKSSIWTEKKKNVYSKLRYSANKLTSHDIYILPMQTQIRILSLISKLKMLPRKYLNFFFLGLWAPPNEGNCICGILQTLPSSKNTFFFISTR